MPDRENVLARVKNRKGNANESGFRIGIVGGAAGNN